MAEYRELQAAIDAIIAMERHDFEEDHFPDAEYAYNDGLIAAMNAVAAIPAADVAEVRHGRWIGFPECLKYPNAYSDDHIVCSVCEECFSVLDNDTERFNCCPNCGAKMDEEDNDG